MPIFAILEIWNVAIAIQSFVYNLSPWFFMQQCWPLSFSIFVSPVGEVQSPVSMFHSPPVLLSAGHLTLPSPTQLFLLHRRYHLWPAAKDQNCVRYCQINYIVVEVSSLNLFMKKVRCQCEHICLKIKQYVLKNIKLLSPVELHVTVSLSPVRSDFAPAGSL